MILVSLKQPFIAADGPKTPYLQWDGRDEISPFG
jgi:hypothetical protein